MPPRAASPAALRESDNLAQMAVIEEWTTLESLGWAAKAVPSEVMEEARSHSTMP
jgi:hypothetical protein